MATEKSKIVYDKIPPQALELEDAIIGCILNDENLLLLSMSIIKPECFHNLINKNIYECFCDMSIKEIPIDAITTTNHLRSLDMLDDIGGAYAVTLLQSKNTNTSNFEFYCYVIFELFVKRSMITLFQEETNNVYKPDSDIYEIYKRVNDKLESIFDTLSDKQIKHMQDSISKTINEIEGYHSGSDISYIKTGIRIFDEHVFLAPKMILGIAASRGAGKTRYLIRLIKSILTLNDPKNIAVLWYSMEDSDTKIIRLFAAPKVGLNDQQMQSKNYKLSTSEIESITGEINKFSNYNIDFINEQDDMATMSRNFTRFMKKHDGKTCFLLIDNVMLIDDLYNSKGGNQLQIEDSIAANLRKIVNKAETNGHKAIIIFLHHMTKEMESRSNSEEAYRPKLVHMKGSTRFADIANAVILLNNPGLHKDLVKKHAVLPHIKCVNSDGSFTYVKRDVLLSNMLIAEVAKNRDGEMADDNKAIERCIVDLGLMKFNELKTKK